MSSYDYSKARRYLLYPFDFDTRATTLSMEIKDEWEDRIKQMHQNNKDKTTAILKNELGEHNFDMKLANFIELGSSPFSLVSYHNILFHQARYAFYHGYYYPALVAACALGERMLNHMILDLRDEYKNTPEYKKVYRKSSFDNWEVPIATLESWGVFQNEEVEKNFTALKKLRNNSIHFNVSTYVSLRDDALLAIQHLGKIIDIQFGYGWPKKCIIDGTKGHFFIKQAYEEDPFIKHFIIPSCPHVSPVFSINFADDGILFFDFKDCDYTVLTDQKFAEHFNNRRPDNLAPSTMPVKENVFAMKRNG